MKQLLAYFTGLLAVLLFSGCSESSNRTVQPVLENRPVVPLQEPAAATSEGIGRFAQVSLPDTIDQQKAAAGKQIFETSCAACHRLTAAVINGPGLLHITDTKKPAWILNLLTNTTQMLQEDPVLAAKTEIYQTRMPDLQLTDEAAFAVLEFLRQNDAAHKTK